MRRHQDEIEQAGARIVAIGTGNADYSAAFVRDEAIGFTVLVDGEGEAARAASIANASIPGLFTPKVFVDRFGAFRSGHRQKKTGARPLQLGATFVIAPGGELLYEHRDADTSDHAPIADVIAALAR